MALWAHRPRSVRKQPRLRPLRASRRENPIDKNSLRSSGVGSAFDLLFCKTPSLDHTGLARPSRGHPTLTNHARGFSLPALSYRLFPRSTRLSWAQPLRPPRAVGAGESEVDPAAQVLAPAGVGRLHGLPTSRAGPRKVLGTGIPERREHGGGPGHGGDSCSPSGEGLRD